MKHVDTYNGEPTAPRKSNLVQRHNNNYKSAEWVSLVMSINEEKILWATYWDPNMFIPKLKGIKTVLCIKHMDPMTYKLWSWAIRAKIKNLIMQGTFKLEKAQEDDFSIPTTLVFKVKLTLNGEWDKAKARICVRGDIQGKHEQEETWSPTSTKCTRRTFLANVARNSSIVKQLDYVGAFLQTPVLGSIFVHLHQEFEDIYLE